MASLGPSPAVTYTPHYDQSGPAIPNSPSPVHSLPLRQPPTAHLGQQVYNDSSHQSRTYDHLKREHGSFSSASTDSSLHTTPHHRVDPMHVYSNTFSLSSQAEGGSMETWRATRAYPNQYTRPSRCEMAEINAAYHQSQQEDSSSENSEDHAIWIVVCCYLVVDS
jgi:hypothetical protein